MNLTRISKFASLVALPLVLTVTTETYAQDQYPILDKIAAKVVLKYQGSSCQQLREQKAEKKQPSAEEQKAIQFLKSDPQMRAHFLNKVAGPIANKMFECGMIP